LKSLGGVRPCIEGIFRMFLGGNITNRYLGKVQYYLKTVTGKGFKKTKHTEYMREKSWFGRH
jgi:hypothetical protein